MSETSTHPYATGLRWFRRLLSGQPHQIIGGHNDPYMLRWYVIPRNPLLNVYVHRSIRSDDDRALHDHPWWFVSVILRGGYAEVSETADGKKLVKIRYASEIERLLPRQWAIRFGRRQIAFRPATYRHRVKLIENEAGQSLPCLTLIVTGPKRRGWGFWCKERGIGVAGSGIKRERFVPWREWGDAGCGA